MKSRIVTTLLGFLGVLALGSHPARTAEPSVYPLPMITVPQAMVAPLVNGAQDDPAWTNAAVIPALGGTIKDGVRVKKVFPTEVRLLWDPQYLYVRFYCEDSEIYAPFDTRDAEHYRGDVAEIFLDVVGDSKQYVELQINPKNSIFDQVIMLTTDARSTENLLLTDEVLQRNFWTNASWNMDGLRTATGRLVKDGKGIGWVADIAVPAQEALHRLGENTFHPMTLRAHLIRYEWPKPTGNETERPLYGMTWSTILDGCPHISPQGMGFLRLVQ